jgi:DNA-binding transcriptional ArsR family regulator
VVAALAGATAAGPAPHPISATAAAERTRELYAPGAKQIALDIILVITKVSCMEALTAIASPRKQEILRLVWRDERSAGDIHAAMPDVSFGAVSLHLSALKAAGLVSCRADGRFRYYRAERRAFGPVGRMLETLWDDALWRLKLAAELEASRRGPSPQMKKPRTDKKAANDVIALEARSTPRTDRRHRRAA